MTLLTRRLMSDQWSHRTVQSLFRETCAERDEQTALYYQDGRWTYSELRDQVDSLTAALVRRGITEGDVVSFLPSPTPDFAVVYFAILQAGAVANPLNVMWSAAELESVLERNRPKAIVSAHAHGQRDLLSTVDACMGDMRPLRIAAGDSAREGWERLSQLIGEPVSDEETARIEERVRDSTWTDRQFICQTSGSTGVSKSAVWNHRSPLAMAHFGAEALGLDDSDAYLNLAPFYHNSGICASLTMCLSYAGISLQLFDTFDPDAALAAVAENGLTATFGFAAHWTALEEAVGYSRETFGIRRALLAGDSGLHRKVTELCQPGAVVANLYAQTENGPLISVTERGCIDENLRVASNGRPLPGVEVVIRDMDAGTPVPDGDIGEICYRSPFLFDGYLDATGSVNRPLDANGYFRSGDVGRIDGGHLTFIERLGNVVKSGGENVSLARVTQALHTVLAEDCADVQAVAVPHEYWGQMVVALLRTPADAPLDRSDLRARCRAVLAAYEIPQVFVAHPDEWPVSPEGKLNLRALIRYAEVAVANAPGDKP